MAISIVDYELPYDTHNLYDVTFYSATIHTLVTNSPPLVDQWLAETNNPTIVGLDVEWRANMSRNADNVVATLQLCVSGRCLIFQMIHSPYMPESLMNWLGNENHMCVGVGIEEDVEKLLVDYGIRVAKTVDLRGAAAEYSGKRELKNAGLKTLAKEILGKIVEKPRKVTMSRWDCEWLTPKQVQYACIDAFLSWDIGRTVLPPPIAAAVASASASSS